MAKAGDFRFNPASRKWEIFLSPGGWTQLSEYAPDFAAVIEGTEYTKVEEFDGRRQRQFGYPGDDPGELFADWFTYDQLAGLYQEEQEERAAFGDPPPGHIGPWPIETKDDEIDYDASNKALAAAEKAEKAAAKEEKPSGAYASRAAAQQAVASNPELAGFTPTYVPSTGQWQLAPPVTTGLDRETARLQAESQLVRQQQGQQAGQGNALELAIDQAFIAGDFDKFIVLSDFRDRPTNMELFRLALQYGDTPEEFQSIMAFGQSLFQPPESMFQPALAGGPQADLSTLPPELGGQIQPPSTAAMQADAQSQNLRQTAGGGWERWDRDLQAWVAYNPNAAPIVSPGGTRFDTAGTTPRFAGWTDLDQQGIEPILFPDPKPKPINSQEFEPFMAEGPDLSDVPTPAETKAAYGGKVFAPPGVFIPEDVKNNPNMSFYNPNKEMQFNDFVNALDAQVGAKGGYSPGEREGFMAAKAAQLGIQNPLRKKKPTVQPALPQSIFDRRKKKEPSRQMFTAPRFIGAR